MSTVYSAGSFSTAGAGTSGSIAMTGAGGYSIANAVSSINTSGFLFGNNNQWGLRITPDLKIETNPDAHVTDAAKYILDVVQKQLNVTLPRTPDWHDLTRAEIYALMEQFDCVSLEVRTLIMKVVQKLKEKNHVTS